MFFIDWCQSANRRNLTEFLIIGTPLNTVAGNISGEIPYDQTEHVKVFS